MNTRSSHYAELKTSNVRRSIATDPVAVLYAKPLLAKNKHPTRQLHYNGEEVIQENKSSWYTLFDPLLEYLFFTVSTNEEARCE